MYVADSCLWIYLQHNGFVVSKHFFFYYNMAINPEKHNNYIHKYLAQDKDSKQLQYTIKGE